MLRQISWSQFIWSLGLILFLYYLYIGQVYYRKELFSLLRPGRDVSTDASTQVQNLSKTLDILFERAASERMVKEELLQAVRSLLQGNPDLKYHDVRESLNLRICMEARNRCQIDFSPEDISRLWGT